MKELNNNKYFFYINKLNNIYKIIYHENAK